MTLTVLLADDPQARRGATRALIERFPDFTVIKQCAFCTGRDLVRLAAQYRPDLAVIPLAQCEWSDLEAIASMSPHGHAIRVIVFSLCTAKTTT